MEPNLFKYIWRHSKGEQLSILLLVLLSMPFYFIALDLPKRIVNQGLLGDGFQGPGTTQQFLALNLPYGDALFGHKVQLFGGFALDQRGLLLALSFSFLALVVVNGLFKFQINTSKGRLGERMLRRLRYELTDRILRFPIPHVRKVKQAEVATMIKDEVEPLGGFIGDAFISPAFLGGQAVTAMAFIMIQNLWLGVVAATIVLVQAMLIPRLRIPILRLGRQRQLTSRQLAGRIAEMVDGAVEVHSNDTSNLERADVASRLGRIFDIRFEIYQRKFFVKFLNNFLAQVTPFAFYAGGGLLALAGRLDVGALVAVIAAYKDLPGPIKELIDWEQQRQDVQIKYDQVIEQFEPGEVLDPAVQDIANDPGPPLTGAITATAVSLTDDAGTRLLEGVSFSVDAANHVAVIGPPGCGKEQLAYLLAGLLTPHSGSIRIGGQDVAKLPEAVTGRRIAYLGLETYLFPFSVRDNLLYSLRERRTIRSARRKSPKRNGPAIRYGTRRRTGPTTRQRASAVPTRSTTRSSTCWRWLSWTRTSIASAWSGRSTPRPIRPSPKRFSPRARLCRSGWSRRKPLHSSCASIPTNSTATQPWRRTCRTTTW